MVDPLRGAVGGEAAHVGARDDDLGGGLAGVRVDHAIHRVVGGQVDGDLGAVRTLADEIEAVVEELAEQHEPAVDRRHAGVGGTDEVLGVALRLGVQKAGRLQVAVVVDLGEAVGVLDDVVVAIGAKGRARRRRQLADHARRVVHHVLYRVGRRLFVVGARRGRRGELQCIKRIRVDRHHRRIRHEIAIDVVVGRVAGVGLQGTRQRLDVLVKHHLGALQERLVVGAPVCVHEVQVVVVTRRLAQAGEIGHIGVGGAVRSDVGQSGSLVGIGHPGGHVVGVVDGAGAVPLDDGIALFIEQRLEVDLFFQKLQVVEVEGVRFELVVGGHGIPLKRRTTGVRTKVRTGRYLITESGHK